MFTFLMFSIAREKDAYRLAGLILAWSVVHGGPGGKFLCPTLYDSVAYGPDVGYQERAWATPTPKETKNDNSNNG